MNARHKQFKVVDVVDTRMKQMVVIEFLTGQKINPIEIYKRLNSVYGEHTVNVSRVRCWIKVMSSIFRDKERILLLGFSLKSISVNSKRYKGT
jgi:hypothetical protein